MALKAADRALTIVITATLTSAVWIIAGGSFIELARERSGIEKLTTPVAPSAGAAGEGGVQRDAADPAHPGTISLPDGLGTGSLIIPVAGVGPSELVDSFTDDRGSGSRLHEALDIMAPEGTPVVAAAPGTVEKLFRSEQGGKTIYVRSEDRLTITYYAHLQDYASGLREGQRVRQGQQIGTVGYTGNASPDAPHLHFAVLRTTADADWWEPATAINPHPLLANRSPT